MDEVFNKNISVFNPKDPQGGKMEIKRKITLEDLLSILDEASEIIIYYNKLEYGGNLEDMDFRKEIEVLRSKKVLNALPCKMVGFANMEAYSGNPYLEIELGD